MPEVATELQQMIQKYVAVPFGATGLERDVPLGAGGVGMDSVSIVMLLLECETRWGVSFPAEMLEQPLTLGRMLDHLQTRSGT